LGVPSLGGSEQQLILAKLSFGFRQIASAKLGASRRVSFAAFVPHPNLELAVNGHAGRLIALADLNRFAAHAALAPTLASRV
jgi:hypothetical protein